MMSTVTQGSSQYQVITIVARIVRDKAAAEARNDAGVFDTNDPVWAQAHADAVQAYNSLRSMGYGWLVAKIEPMRSHDVAAYLNSALVDDIKVHAGIPPDGWIQGPTQSPPDPANDNGSDTNGTSSWGSALNVTPSQATAQLLYGIGQLITQPGQWAAAQVNAVQPFVKYIVPVGLAFGGLAAFRSVFRIKIGGAK